MSIRNLEPQKVWEIFHDITQIPRPSKKEEKILKWLKEFADFRGYTWKQDEVGNLAIYAPATKGMKDRKSICIQAHVDMVTEKNRDTEFDFDNEALETYIDGDWVKAKGTTLGADNGMGLAMGLAIIADNSISRPDTTILCTVDEETGLTGANQLSPAIIDGDILINLDTEEFGHFTIGCAGGINTFAKFYLDFEEASNATSIEVFVKGLKGGHSGLEIHTPRANSNKLLLRILAEVVESVDLRLVKIEGGNKHNAIPRESFATIVVDDKNSFERAFDKALTNARNEWGSAEKNLDIGYRFSENSDTKSITTEDTEIIISTLDVVPNGVVRYHPMIGDLVQTSSNLAILKTDGSNLNLLSSQRSSVDSEKSWLANSIKNLLELGGAEAGFTDGYPAWEPSMESEILSIGKELYKKRFGKEPVIETVHAGLECGIVSQKKPGMDMISFGPDIREAHTPDEMVSISTTRDCWDLLVDIVGSVPTK
ncbi:MAG: aminoacyl-histidine dipeptidase [Candidatus Kapaibacteriales bacterium]